MHTARGLKTLSIALAFAAIAGMATPAAAQAVRVRGSIEKAEASALEVRTREGDAIRVQLAAGATVGRRIKADASAIHPQDYVGVTSIPGKNGALQAVEIFVFPPAMRGVGEGHRPFDLLPESTMTNATIAETVDATDGRTLHLTYKGGDKLVLLAPDTRFFVFEPGSTADLQPGRPVSLSVEKAGDQMTTARVTVDMP